MQIKRTVLEDIHPKFCQDAWRFKGSSKVERTSKDSEWVYSNIPDDFSWSKDIVWDVNTRESFYIFSDDKLARVIFSGELEGYIMFFERRT